MPTLLWPVPDEKLQKTDAYTEARHEACGGLSEIQYFNASTNANRLRTEMDMFARTLVSSCCIHPVAAPEDEACSSPGLLLFEFWER